MCSSRNSRWRDATTHSYAYKWVQRLQILLQNFLTAWRLIASFHELGTGWNSIIIIHTNSLSMERIKQSWLFLVTSNRVVENYEWTCRRICTRTWSCNHPLSSHRPHFSERDARKWHPGCIRLSRPGSSEVYRHPIDHCTHDPVKKKRPDQKSHHEQDDRTRKAYINVGLGWEGQRYG